MVAELKRDRAPDTVEMQAMGRWGGDENAYHSMDVPTAQMWTNI